MAFGVMILALRMTLHACESPTLTASRSEPISQSQRFDQLNRQSSPRADFDPAISYWRNLVAAKISQSEQLFFSITMFPRYARIS